jgi:hypothetical protein
VSVSHSQGPWRLSAGDETAVFSASNQHIFNARCGGTGSPRLNEAEANARLCAAAPDLLHELRNAIMLLEEFGLQDRPGCFLEAACAAIAKATS